MKLIQQLERKLSWRSSQRSTPGLAEAKAKQRKENGKKQRQQQQLMAAKTAAAVRVSDAEFSPYISFGCGLKTVPLNDDDDSSPSSYEVVAIRTRAPFQTIVAQQSSLYSSPHHLNHHHHPRSPSPRSESHRPESAGSGGDHHHHHHQLQQQQQQQKSVEHIYDQIDCHHRRSSSLSPTTTAHYQNHDHHQWSPSSEGKQNHFGNQSPTASSGSNESSGSGTGSGSSHCGPITVTGGSSRRRRNRIKTNPWFAGSPWAAPATKSSKENHQQQQQQQQDKENIYESIENLLNSSRKQKSPSTINQSYTRPFAQPPPQNSSATYLRRPARPTSLAVQKRKHLMETYPTSPMYLSSNQTVNPAEETPADLFLFTSPSVEFLNQSQQLCRQISSYFEDMSSRASPPPPREALNSSSTTTRPSLERKVDTLHQQTSLLLFNNSSDSMETIDLSPVNPFSHHHHHQPALSEWSLAAEEDNDDDNDHQNDHHQWDHTTVPTVSSPAPPPPPPSTMSQSPSPPARNKRKLHSPTSRPESLYSNPNNRRQSAKVDRLKCQLKEVVHAAIQQAKTKKKKQGEL